MRLVHVVLGAILCVAPVPAFAQTSAPPDCTTLLECAQVTLQRADRALRALEIAAPVNAVVAFNAAQCPAGWAPYEQAQGRFIRGLDPTGKQDAKREVGSRQADALQGHAHATEAKNGSIGIWDSVQGSGPLHRAAITNYTSRRVFLIQGPISLDGFGSVRVANETRPKNVALLYCIRTD